MYDLADAAGSYNESWERVALTTGGSVENIGAVQAKWSGAISQMQKDTDRGAGLIRSHIQAMGIAGVTNTKTIEESFRGIAGASYATGTDISSLDYTFQKAAQSGILSSRTLMSAGINSSDVFKATKKTVAQLSDSFKTMTPNQRAAALATILNTKYNKEGNDANEAYKQSWQDVKDQAGLAGDYLKRVAGGVILPILIPAVKIATSWLKQLGDWFNGLSGPTKTYLGILVVGAGIAGIFAGAIVTLIALKKTFSAVTNLSKLAQAGETAANTANTASIIGNTTSNTANTAGITLNNAAKNEGILASIRSAASTVAHTAVEGARTVALYATAAAQWALNAAMDANPIGIIILLILALVAVLIYLWTTNSTFRADVIATWVAISGAFINAGQSIYGTLTRIWAGIVWFLTLLPRLPLLIGLYLASAVLKFVSFAINAAAKAKNAGMGIVNAITSTISSIPGKMFTWGSQLLTNFVNGIKSQFGSLTGALQWISDHLPHSPPKIGPLSTITAANMFAWASDIAGAGSLGFSSFSLNGINTALPSVSSGYNSSYGSASLGFDATEINNALSINANGNNQRPIVQYINQEGIMSENEAATRIVQAVKDQLWKENLIEGKSEES
jgi:hypothetical protein